MKASLNPLRLVVMKEQEKNLLENKKLDRNNYIQCFSQVPSVTKILAMLPMELFVTVRSVCNIEAKIEIVMMTIKLNIFI